MEITLLVARANGYIHSHSRPIFAKSAVYESSLVPGDPQSPDRRSGILIDGAGRAPWFPSRRYSGGPIELKLLTFEYSVAALEGSARAPLSEQDPPSRLQLISVRECRHVALS